MKLHMLIIFFMSLYVKLHAQQTTPDTIPFIAYWKENDVLRYKISTIKKLSEDGILIKNDTLSHVMEIEVERETTTTYNLKWSLNKYLSYTYVSKEKNYNSLSELLFTDVIRYRTDETGAIINIENWEIVSNNVKQLFAESVEYNWNREKVSVAKKDSALHAFEKMYDSRVLVEQVFFKDLSLLHFPYGYEFVLGDTLQFQDEMPNSMGGAPIRGDSQVFLSEIDSNDKKCELIYKTRYKKGEGIKLFVSMFESLGVKSNGADKVLEEGSFDVSINNNFTYDYYWNTMEVVRSTKDINFYSEEKQYSGTEQLLIQRIR